MGLKGRTFWIPAFIFGALIAGGCGFEGLTAAQAEVSKVIDSLFLSLDQGTWRETYETATTADFRGAFSREEYGKLGQGIHDRLGRLLSKEVRGFNLQTFNGVVSAEVGYEAQFEKGKGSLQVRLRKSDGKWLLLSLRVTSPVFLENAPSVPCAGCGKARPTDAKFCPSCGQKVDPAPSAPGNK